MKKIIAIILVVFLCISNVYGAQQTSSYSIQINAASRILRLYCNGVLIKEYPVAVGKPTTKTPLGNFVIRNKAKNPVWNNKGNPIAPGPRNPLGIRWMGISAPQGTYGIHGNNVPKSISTFASGGCIRMFNNDVEELYNIVEISTPVHIIYENIELKQDSYRDSPALIVYPDIYKLKNAERTLKKILENHPDITQEKQENALKLSASIKRPVVIGEGIGVLLNDQYITSAAYIEENQVYLLMTAAADYLGVDEEIATAYEIPIVEKDNKAYLNLTEAFKKFGGKIEVDASNSNVYLVTSLLKVNGRYLSDYRGDFDKEYKLDSNAINAFAYNSIANNILGANLREQCKEQNWQFTADSLKKTIDISIPLRLKITDAYINAVPYKDRYYIDSADAAVLEDIQNQNLTTYAYKDKIYYDVYEIMEKYQCTQDAFFTTIEVIKPVKNEV